MAMPKDGHLSGLSGRRTDARRRYAGVLGASLFAVSLLLGGCDSAVEPRASHTGTPARKPAPVPAVVAAVRLDIDPVAGTVHATMLRTRPEESGVEEAAAAGSVDVSQYLTQEGNPDPHWVGRFKRSCLWVLG